MKKPAVGDLCHYASFGTPGGEYTSQCRAAVIADIPSVARLTNDTVVVDLVVFNPTGLFFNRCPQDENWVGGKHKGGT